MFQSVFAKSLKDIQMKLALHQDIKSSSKKLHKKNERKDSNSKPTTSTSSLQIPFRITHYSLKIPEDLEKIELINDHRMKFNLTIEISPDYINIVDPNQLNLFE